jgi:hypothetical protein
VKVLDVERSDDAPALAAIANELLGFYRTSHKDVYEARRPEIDRAVTAVQQIYQRNVFPEMRVRFGTYPNNAGHVDFPGCFRCHDDSHRSTDGRTISQDCESCHTIE